MIINIHTNTHQNKGAKQKRQKNNTINTNNTNQTEFDKLNITIN